MFPSEIDLVIYINLDNRTDRRMEVEQEFQRAQVPQERILRWPATRLSKNPALGCTLSHIAVLEHILTLPPEVKNILILEDDFNFVDDINLVHSSLNQFLQYPRDTWELILLCYTVLEKEPYNDLVSLSLFSQGTAGYLLNRDSAARLLENFKEGRDKLAETNKGPQYAVDMYWWKFMSNRKTFFFNQPLGFQRESYSNILGVVRTVPSLMEKTDQLNFYKTG
jgi:glycosyl transferase family 25